MARIIPPNFDVNKEALDSNELVIRDTLKVKIVNWAKFRFSIYAGNSSDVLLSPNPIDNDVKQAFIELAKSHYEVVNSIGYAKFSLSELQTFDKAKLDYLFRINKGLKEFYIHLGSVFDNLARLIFILNIADSATQKKGSRLIRHWIDWPQLSKEYSFSKHSSIINNQILNEILVLRNNYIHNWRSVIFIDSKTGDLFLSNQIRADRNYLWHYEESAEFNSKYRNDLKPLIQFMTDDFNFVENCQNTIFEQLIFDLSIFETNYNLKIKE